MLPKLTHTLHTHRLVGLGKEIKFRAFTNNEQKTLLLAKQEKENNRVVIDAVKQIVSACTLGKLNVDLLSTFDLEDLFLRIRSKSVSEVSNIRYRFDHEEDGKPVSKFIDISINLDEVKVKTDPNHTNKFMLTDDIGIQMKYPSFEASEYPDDELPMRCIESVFTKDGDVTYIKDVSEADLLEFYGDIDMKGLLKIKDFFDTMPKLSHVIKVPLPTGETREVVLEGLQSFF
jgi:hypothetical protein